MESEIKNPLAMPLYDVVEGLTFASLYIYSLATDADFSFATKPILVLSASRAFSVAALVTSSTTFVPLKASSIASRYCSLISAEIDAAYSSAIVCFRLANTITLTRTTTHITTASTTHKIPTGPSLLLFFGDGV